MTSSPLTDQQLDETARLEDGSTHTVQHLLDAGEACVQQHCRAAREQADTGQRLYQMRQTVDAALDELDDLILDGTVTAGQVANVRHLLRDALGLN